MISSSKYSSIMVRAIIQADWLSAPITIEFSRSTEIHRLMEEVAVAGCVLSPSAFESRKISALVAPKETLQDRWKSMALRP